MLNISIAALSRPGERAACFVVCDNIASLPGGDVTAGLAGNAIITRLDGDEYGTHTGDSRRYLFRARP